MMSYIFGILVIFGSGSLHFTSCQPVQTTNNGMPQPSAILPHSVSHKSINSSSIQVNWIPGRDVQHVNLTEYAGNVTVGIYAGDKSSTYRSLINFPSTSLNESGVIIIDNLNADSVYKIFFDSIWRGNGSGTTFMATTSSVRWVRTYMEDQITRNPVPDFAELTWEQIEQDYKIVAVIFNVTSSLLLPYENRKITLYFDSQNQSQALDPTADSVQFQLDVNITKAKIYIAQVVYTADDRTVRPYFRPGRTTQNSFFNIEITPPSPPSSSSTIPPPSIGIKQFQYNSIFLVYVTLFILFEFNK